MQPLPLFLPLSAVSLFLLSMLPLLLLPQFLLPPCQCLCFLHNGLPAVRSVSLVMFNILLRLSNILNITRRKISYPAVAAALPLADSFLKPLVRGCSCSSKSGDTTLAVCCGAVLLANSSCSAQGCLLLAWPRRRPVMDAAAAARATPPRMMRDWRVIVASRMLT